MQEFDRITERGGVLGAMETMYQRSKIQEESMHYEWLKHTGEYPIIGVNTFLGKDGSPTVLPGEVIRSTEEEKQLQIQNLRKFQKSNEDKTQRMVSNKLQLAAINQTKFIRSDDGSCEILLSRTNYQCTFRSGWKVSEGTCSFDFAQLPIITTIKNSRISGVFLILILFCFQKFL